MSDEPRPMTKADFPVLQPEAIVAEIRARDARVQRCKDCGGYSGGAHDSTVEECEEISEKQGRAPYKFYQQSAEEIAERSKELGPKHLCWNISDHHPFVENETLEGHYYDAEVDRRTLLRLIEKYPLYTYNLAADMQLPWTDWPTAEEEQ